MNLVKFKLSNFGPYKEAEAAFPQKGIIGIVGPNGSGKSTILSSLEYALYGSAALPNKVAEHKWSGAGGNRKMAVAWQVLIDGRTHEIVRDETMAKLYQHSLAENAPENEKSVVAIGHVSVTKYVEQALGMNLHEFRASYLSRQKDMGRLSEMTPMERQKFVRTMMQGDVLDAALASIRSKTAKVKAGRDAAEQRMQKENEKLQDIDSLRRQQDRAKIQHEELTVRVTDARQAVADHKTATARLEDRKTAAQNAIAAAEAKMALINEMAPQHTGQRPGNMDFRHWSSVLDQKEVLEDILARDREKPLDKHLVELGERIRAEERLLFQSERATSKVRRRLRQMMHWKEAGTCNACNQDVSHLAPDAEIEKAEELIAQSDRDAQRQKDRIKSLQKAERDVKETIRVKKDLAERIPKAESAFYAYHAAKAEIATATEQLKKAGEALEAYPPKKEMAAALADATVERRRVAETLNQLTIDIGLAEAALISYRELRKEWKSAKKDYLLHQQAARFLDRMRLDYVGGIRPELEEGMSSFVSLLTDGRHDSVSIDENLRVVLNEHGIPAPVVSGGTQDIADLALRLAVSHLLSARSGSRLSVLALDEPFGSMDALRRQNVFSLLRRLKAAFDQIVLITHSPEIRDAADFSITCERSEYSGHTHSVIKTKGD